VDGVVKHRWFAIAAALIAAGSVGVARPARAHPEQAPTLINRYVTVSPAGPHLGVHLELLFGTLPAAEQRRIMDRDHDGRIGLEERSAELRAWTAKMAQPDPLVRVAIDGVTVPITLVAELDLGGDDRVDDKPFVLEFAGQIELGPGEHRIDVDAGPDLARMGETEIVLDAANPWLMRATLNDKGQAQGPQKLLRHPVPRAQPSDRRGATFIIYSGGPAEDDRANPTLPIVMVLISVVLGVGLVAMVRRLERARKAAAADQDRGADEAASAQPLAGQPPK
jgi:hypothetical protein